MAINSERPRRLMPLSLPAPFRAGKPVRPGQRQRSDGEPAWYYYRNGAAAKAGSWKDAARLSRNGHGFVWVVLERPSPEQLEDVATTFALHPLAVEDALHGRQRPKVETYDTALLVVMKTARYSATPRGSVVRGLVEIGEVLTFVGDGFVVTVRHGSTDPTVAAREALEADPTGLRRGPSAVLHAVADAIVDGYTRVCDELEYAVDDLEQLVFSREQVRDVDTIYGVKRDTIEMRRAVMPLERPLADLAREELPFVDEQTRAYFRDVEDHLARARQQIADFGDMLDSLLSARLAQLSIEENQDMRRMTAWAAVIAVPTAIAGIYGMNFSYMPELRWHYGYPAALAGIALVCGLLWLRFKKSGWL